ncbi:MAG: glycosyltransferase family 4 protein [Mediterranea sp.]|jgi:glycosyltransferase involved in cell wall biosynthesis|nr:glycosyltransferase family 4 protein [Mediterranea sp.]
MKIAIEAQRIFRHDKHGMDFVILEVLRELQKLDDGNHYYVIVAPGEDVCLTPSNNLSIIELKCPTYPLWEQIALPRAVRRLGVDLLHCTSNTAPLHSPVPLILTLHDIIYLEPRTHRSLSLYQEMGRYYRRWVVPRIVRRCRHIITVSQFEQECIRRALHIAPQHISAVYNGYNLRFREQNIIDINIVQQYLPQTDYLFFLGNTDPKKNTVGTLKAYSLYLKESRIKRPLLIADLKESYIDRILLSERLESIKPYLYHPGYIPHLHLPTLYNAAFAFLYPSLRESFGIPLLESMACGTPVISSNTSAIPEIAGDGALLVDPYQPQAIADALLRLENESEFYQQQMAYGLKRAQKFSWAQTAQAYSTIYQKITKS